jgi:eukaryotic-like serine/threonine-protein kinase
MSTSQSVPVAPVSRLPRKFGRYALFDFIGKGGMAEIFLARAHTELGAARLCVVKQILPEFSTHPQFADMLIHEAKLAARLNHAHIVQVFDLGRERDQLYIAMEYVEGFDLNALLRRCSQKRIPLPLEFALLIVTDTLRGLDYAHRRVTDDGKPLGIVHRDVSPSNVLVSLEGEVKLCDFGIAHANDAVLSEGGEMDEAIKGKAGYMSPEHANGEPIDARADVFAVGIVMWELLAGKRMYKKEGGDIPLLDQAKRAEIPALPEKGLPHEAKLHRLVMKSLAKNRDERYPTAGAMLRDIEAFMSEAKLVASPLKLGDWLVESFGDEILEQRRAREGLPPVAPSSSPPAATSLLSSPPTPAPSAPPISSASPSAPPPSTSAPAPSVAPSAATPPDGLAIARPAGIEVDPPSLPAATVDVVPSSAMRARARESAAPRRNRALVIVVVGVIIAVAIALMVMAGGLRR